MSHVKRFWLAAFMAAVVALLPTSVQAQAIRDPDAEAAFKAGEQLLSEQKYKEAVAAFNQALQPDPTWADALVGKGDALLALEDYQSAALAYSHALNSNANSAAAYNGRGEAYLAVGQQDMAIADFNSALDLDPNNPKILSNIGHVLVNSRDPQSALRRLDDALALNDKDARAYRDRGLAHVLIGEFDKAEADVQRAVEVEPDDYENFSVMASVYLLQDKQAPALAAITKAIEVYQPQKIGEPNIYIDGYLSRADGWLKLGEKEKDAAKSQVAFENVIADTDAVLAIYADRFPYNGSAYYRKGRAQRMLQRYPDAIDSLTRAIQAAPEGQEVPYMADAYMYRGICWYHMKQTDLARGDFEQASGTGNGFQDPRVFLWIGFTHHAEGDYREAITAYNEAIAKSPGFSMAHVNKGRAYMDLKEYNPAIESFNHAIRAEPGVGEHYYNTGAAYMRLKEPERAVQFLNLALKKENPQPKMFRLMATALRELGRNELAEEYERKAEAPPAQAAGQ